MVSHTIHLKPLTPFWFGFGWSPYVLCTINAGIDFLCSIDPGIDVLCSIDVGIDVLWSIDAGIWRDRLWWHTIGTTNKNICKASTWYAASRIADVVLRMSSSTFLDQNYNGTTTRAWEVESAWVQWFCYSQDKIMQESCGWTQAQCTPYVATYFVHRDLCRHFSLFCFFRIK